MQGYAFCGHKMKTLNQTPSIQNYQIWPKIGLRNFSITADNSGDTWEQTTLNRHHSLVKSVQWKAKLWVILIQFKKDKSRTSLLFIIYSSLCANPAQMVTLYKQCNSDYIAFRQDAKLRQHRQTADTVKWTSCNTKWRDVSARKTLSSAGNVLAAVQSFSNGYSAS